jgi:phosphatidylinositol glycan class O
MTLALATAAHLELVNAARDVRALQASFSVDPAGTLAHLQQGLPTTEVEQQQGAAGVRVDEVVPIALLARLAFLAGRHQATFVSLQWKATFVLTPTLSYSLACL